MQAKRRSSTPSIPKTMSLPITSCAASTLNPALDRMLIVGNCFGIRSERRLCEEVHLNLAYRWFCRLACTFSDVTTEGSISANHTLEPASPYRLVIHM